MFEGIYAQDMASMEHPPLTTCLTAAGAFLAGGFHEVPLHAAFLVFPLCLVISMYALSRRFTKHPFLSTILLLVLPVVCVMSHTLMADLPLLAFWTSSIAAFTSGVDRNRRNLIWIGALFVVPATLTSWAGLCLIPLLMLYALLSENRSAATLAAVVPAGVVALWLGAQYLHFHRPAPAYTLAHYFFRERVLSPGFMAKKALYAIASLGGLSVSPVALLLLLWQKKRLAALAAPAVAGLLKSAPGVPSGRIWSTGEWGRRSYMERIGAEELGRRDTRPRAGDVLVVPSLATPYQTLFRGCKHYTSSRRGLPYRRQSPRVCPAGRTAAGACDATPHEADRPDNLQNALSCSSALRGSSASERRGLCPLLPGRATKGTFCQEWCQKRCQFAHVP